ncbi:putative late blight resistance protein homolog R1A-10 isoform X2 [Lycium barbarum]|uniref:putative late blight resistance protein homolog R1A-10 isoform X2 n=1 Tax=Lycium barbarum TaxID=112863 RepID=UPI00293E5747|nr:putative late blight resistance protein homolog R1A-10 isoform X2 [Lycium barbarum]
MAAYIAVISLLQTIEQFQQRHPELVQGFTAKTLESLHETAEYFQNVVEEAGKSKFDAEKKKSLEEKIRAAASYAEDIVEMKICQIIEDLNLKYGMAPKSSLYKNLLPFVERVDRKKNEVMEIVSDFSTRIHDIDDDQILESAEDSLIGASSRSNPVLQHFEDDSVHGLDDDLEIIVKRLTERSSNLDIVTITGMGGIGKTTLARKAHDHLTIKNHFDLRIWVTISQEYGSRNVLLEALRCILKNNDIEKDYDKKNDCELADLVQKKLKGPRYLVVVDDIWSTDVWDSIKGIFPDWRNKSRILLTTRESKVAMYANPISRHEMNLLNLENSWKLLCDKVFGPKHDHPELEETGKKIAEKCQGLPLTISVIAGHLSKVARTLGSWKDVARTLGEIIASQTDKCSGVLGLSYHYLPNHLKPCFLSMGGFPEDYQVETWRLIQLWIAEGSIRRPGSDKSLEELGEDYLEDLISRNLITVRKKRFNGEIKACGMHDLVREFCLTEVKMTQFMHVEITDKVPTFMHDEIADIVPTLPAQKHNGRRFSFQMHGYSVDDCCKLLPSVARSIYLFCKFRPSVNLEFFSRFNLLRVLAIFHEYECYRKFPLVITKLFHLRYLQIQAYGNLPESISELQNLQTLIYDGRNNHTTLPGKIWMLRNLRHINTREPCYLPSPRRKSISNKHLVIGMPNIEKLSNLCFTSCTNEIFSRIPNLRRLIVRHKGGRANRLIDISILKKLEAFKFVIDALWSSPPPISIKRSVLPASIKRLTLSGGFCFPWEDMSTLVMLPNLQELKLKNRAAYGKEWRLSDKYKFKSLKLLLFRSLDLEHWEASSDNFPNLERLVLKICKYLKEIPTDFEEICTLESIELYQCGTSVVDSAKEIEQERLNNTGNNSLKVYVHRFHWE